MQRRKKRKTVGKEVAVPLRRVSYPGGGALARDSKETSTPQAKGGASGEGLPFRVDLPSRRWLEQAANSAGSASR